MGMPLRVKIGQDVPTLSPEARRVGHPKLVSHVQMNSQRSTEAKGLATRPREADSCDTSTRGDSGYGSLAYSALAC